MSRDARWLNIIWKHSKMKNIYARRQVELFLDEEERSIQEEYEPAENRIEGDGNNTPTQRKFGLDIGMIGAREETLGRTRSQTQEMSSPRNESMERSDLTMEDWIQETCLISVVTSAPTGPKTFKRHGTVQLKKKAIIGELPSGRKLEACLKEGFGEKQKEKRYPATEDLLEISGYSRSREMTLTGQD